MVVASVLVDSRYLDDVVKVARPEDFADERMRDLIVGMMRMQRAGEPVDVISVGYKLREWGVVNVAPADLHAWVEQVTVAASATFYAEQVVADAQRRKLWLVAARLREEGERDPLAAARDAIAELEAVGESVAADDGRLLSVNDLLDVDVAHDWLVSGLLERKDRLMLTGLEGLGKSTLLRQIVFTTAAGKHPFRDWRDMPPRRVLVLDTENTERQWARATRSFVERLALSSSGVLGENLRVAALRRLDVTAPQDIGMLHRLMDQHDPDVVMIGPLYRLVPRAIMSDDDAAPLLAALDTLRDRDVALLIEAHAGKAVTDKGDRNLAPRGSSALLGWPEFGLGLRAVKGRTGEVELVRWRGDREERAWPRRLTKSSNGLPFQEVVQS